MHDNWVVVKYGKLVYYIHDIYGAFESAYIKMCIGLERKLPEEAQILLKKENKEDFHR